MAHSAAPDPAQAASATSAGIRTLVFDVPGTVADEAGSIAADTAAAPAAAGADPGRGPQLSDEWTRRLDALTDQVVAGEAPWRSNDALRRAALPDAAGATGLAGLPAEGHRWTATVPRPQLPGRSGRPAGASIRR